jgi:hypothetical protein
MQLSTWKTIKEQEERCICGHLMEDHKDFYDACQICDCREFEVKTND